MADSTQKHLLTIPFHEEEFFSKKDLERYLSELRDYVTETQNDDRGGDSPRLLLSIQQCMGSVVENDDEAELVRRGIRLGLHLAAFDRKAYHANVAAQTLRPPEVTVSDEQIIEVVNDIDLPTRSQQAKRLGIGVRALQKRLKSIREREL